MPWKPQTICRWQGCSTLANGPWCEKHRKEFVAEKSKRDRAMYNSQWKKARLIFLRAHPLCVICEEEKRITPATEVDHIIPHRGDKQVFWDQGNWQALCKRCHSRKTVLEGSRFG